MLRRTILQLVPLLVALCVCADESNFAQATDILTAADIDGASSVPPNHEGACSCPASNIGRSSSSGASDLLITIKRTW